MRIFEKKKFIENTDLNVDKENWTLVIPAAGKGSRLNFPGPKILYPIFGKTILEWILLGIGDFFSKILLVINKKYESEIRAQAKKLSKWNIEYTFQNDPRGMADAIWKSKKQVFTENVTVLWGDQVTVDPLTVKTCLYLHEKSTLAKLTFPTIERKNPYINLVRGKDKKIISVMEKREGSLNALNVGESDCGIFCLRTKDLFSLLEKSRAEGLGIGKITNEMNFLPLIPLLDSFPGNIQSLLIEDEAEAIGINTREDSIKVEKVLREKWEK